MVGSRLPPPTDYILGESPYSWLVDRRSWSLNQREENVRFLYWESEKRVRRKSNFLIKKEKRWIPLTLDFSTMAAFFGEGLSSTKSNLKRLMHRDDWSMCKQIALLSWRGRIREDCHHRCPRWQESRWWPHGERTTRASCHLDCKRRLFQKRELELDRNGRLMTMRSSLWVRILMVEMTRG